jgi:hypothetical protein
MEPGAKTALRWSKIGIKTQANGDADKVGGVGEMRPAAGAQVSVATQRTCASTNGTGAYITPSPRLGGSDDIRQW